MEYILSYILGIALLYLDVCVIFLNMYLRIYILDCSFAVLTLRWLCNVVSVYMVGLLRGLFYEQHLCDWVHNTIQNQGVV